MMTDDDVDRVLYNPRMWDAATQQQAYARRIETIQGRALVSAEENEATSRGLVMAVVVFVFVALAVALAGYIGLKALAILANDMHDFAEVRAISAGGW